MIRAGAAPGRARAGIVLLHGRGSQGSEILRLLDHLALPDVAAVAPTAPGRSWWPVSFLSPIAQMQGPLEAALASVAEGVAALEAEGLARGRIWLGGFSQGAVLALESFARRGEGLAGAFGLSGGLIGTADAGTTPDGDLYGYGAKAFDYAGRRDGARVHVSVHERDPHIPLRRARDTADVLRAMGAAVSLRVFPGEGHAVMPEDIAAMRGWLNGQAGG